MSLFSASVSSGVLTAGSSTLNAVGKPVLLHGYVLSGGTAATSITFKDGTTAGAIKWQDSIKAQTAAGDDTVSYTFTPALAFTSDCYVTVAGTAGTAVVIYSNLS